MPKSLVLGNGHILAGFDKHGLLRDFYFPFVGEENQMSGSCSNRIGIFLDGAIHWLSDSDWEVSINYQEEALAGKIRAINKNIGIELILVPVIYNEKNIFIEKVTIKSSTANKRGVRLFFGQQFQLYENSKGDTVYYDPKSKSIVHYKSRRVILISAQKDGVGFNDYAAGLRSIEGKEGTYKDAEDGFLSKNPIEHGTVDSVIGFSFEVSSEKEEIVYYWFVVAKTFEEALELNHYLLEKTPEHLVKTTTNFWRAWVNKSEINFCDLEEKVVSLLKKSLLIIRAHVDSGGGIIASADSDILQLGRDTYNYVWHRDAAFIASALDLAGYPDITDSFFEFCNDVINKEGYFLHKYRPDQSLASSWHPWIKNGQERLPIQEDETATVIWALWNHYQISKDLEFIERVYNSLIKSAADFMISYRDNQTRLPLPSFDLWEEKWGVHTYTAASVYGGLVAASSFAGLLGKDKDSRIYKKAAQEVKDAILKNLYNKEEGVFYKGLSYHNGREDYDKTVDISSFYGLFYFGVLKTKDEILVKAVQKTEERLTCLPKFCGVARYEGDKYHLVDFSMTGNPWILTTLWLAQYQIAAAKNKKELKQASAKINAILEVASSSGILPEQFNPYTAEHISVSPLVWSHAELVRTVIYYLKKMKDLGVC